MWRVARPFAAAARKACSGATCSMAMPLSTSLSAMDLSGRRLAARRARAAARHRPSARKSGVEAMTKLVDGEAHMQAVDGAVPTTPETSVVTPQDTSLVSANSALEKAVPASTIAVMRPIEWGTVLVGYEQANRYELRDEQGTLLGHLMEEEGSIGKAIGRQLLKTRRNFTATLISPDGGQVLMRLRRPAYLVSSTMYVEDGQGNGIGEIRAQWHIWRRKYALYLGTTQFAAIDEPALAWEFWLRDVHGHPLALLDRNFQGFGKELFTDAGKYALHFGGVLDDRPTEVQAIDNQASLELTSGSVPTTSGTATSGSPDIASASAQKLSQPSSIDSSKTSSASPTSLLLPQSPQPAITTRDGVAVPAAEPPPLQQRLIALAAAITIDYDYFSRHSHGGGLMGGMMIPPIIPMPTPTESPEPPAETPGTPGVPPPVASSENADSNSAYGDTSSGAAYPESPPAENTEWPYDDQAGPHQSDEPAWGENDDPWNANDDGDGSGNDDEGGGFFGSLSNFFGNDDDTF